MRSSFNLFTFLLIVIGAWTGLHGWIHHNLALAGMPPAALAVALWALALSFPISRILAIKLHGGVMRLLYWTGTIWMGLGFMLAFWFLLAALARKILAAAGFPEWADPRAWILGAGALVLLLGAMGVARALGPPRIARYAIDRRARYGQGKSARLVQISDVHLGFTLGTPWLARLVDRLNALEPDLVLITGDLMDPEFADDEGAAVELRRLKTRQGVFAVSGNHEFYAGVGRFLALMRAAGIPVLDNESRSLASGLQIAGIHDPTANGMPRAGVRSDLPRALSRLDPSHPSVLMAHQPKGLEGAAERRVDLVLSGHTHAGQIFPFYAFVRMVFKHVSGLHRLGADTDLIVCTGTGFWGPPLRVGTHSEVVVAELSW